MKKIIPILFPFVFFLNQTHLLAQNKSIPNRGCTSMEYKKWEEERDPSIKEIRAKIEEQNRIFIAERLKNPTPLQHTIIKIPVVFHVVYNNNSQNVSDACINAQLKVLNEDFRKLNSDWTNVTQTGWSFLVADCEIEFCLAVRDPDDNPTNGITRTFTNKAEFVHQNDNDNDVKFTAQGGEDGWDRDQYFNIWVCNLNLDNLGYGQFPGGNYLTDGLVMDYQYMVGSAGCGIAPYNKGRTAVHELGHCFGLYHTWGDDNGACSGSDYIADTPNQAKEHYGAFPVGSVTTDACSPIDPGTMWMNFMDYTDDACMYMFTLGQKAVITATMNGSRSPLKTSNGCTPLDVIESLLAPQSISVFPSPSNGEVFINVNIPNTSLINISVTNMIGEVILETKTSAIKDLPIKLDLNNIPSGMYFVKLTIPEGSVTKKIIINK